MSSATANRTGQRSLVLVPTAVELAALPAGSVRRWKEAGAAVELCGLGPIAAAAKTSRLIATLQPEVIVLTGIAGAYDADADTAEEPHENSGPHLVVGLAYEFTAVACHGLGVGEGARHRSSAELGWDEGFQLPEACGAIPLGPSPEANGAGTAASSLLLLSVSAASADRREAATRQHRYPEAVAEDMESYAVAVACRMAGVPLRVIRGISNVAGDRDHRHWKVAAALAAAARLIEKVDLGRARMLEERDRG